MSVVGYKMLIDVPEWLAPYGMFSEKLSISRNESAEISNTKVNHLHIFWTIVIESFFFFLILIYIKFVRRIGNQMQLQACFEQNVEI